MKTDIFLIGAATLALFGCTSPANDDNAANAGLQNDTNTITEAVPAERPAPATDSTGPAAAARLVEDYAALAEKGAFAEAARSWTNATAAAQFAASLEDYPKFKMTPGKPVDEEGAAGSIFITVPLTLDLTLRSGSPYQMMCKATLRRVNDVPGSTAEQRRWNIQTIIC